MADFPNLPVLEPAVQQVLSVSQTLADNACISVQAASTAWPSANLAIFVPVPVATPSTVYKFVLGVGATGAGNFDVGLYDSQGNRIVSSGSTAKGASTEQTVDVTDTRIGPGLYYLALAANGTNNYVGWTLSGTSPVPVQKSRACGVMEMAAAFALPATATFAAASTSAGFVPSITAQLRNY